MNDQPSGRTFSPPRLGLRWLGMMPPEPPPWLVTNLLPQAQLAIIAGVYSAGKTFVACDVAVSTMGGEDAFGGAHDVEKMGGVLWIAAEGANEIDARMTAAAQARWPGINPEYLPFAVQAFEAPRLKDPSALNQLLQLATMFRAEVTNRCAIPLALIVIDTVGSAADFEDGNNNSEVQRVFNMLRQLSDRTKSLVLVIDHYGKNVETGVMGASSKAQSADAILAVLCDKDSDGGISNRRVVVHKVRGASSGGIMPFTLRQVPVGERGRTTCVIDWADATVVAPAKPKGKAPWSGKAKLLRDAMERASIADGKQLRPFGAEGPEVKAVDREKVRDEFYASYAAESTATKRQAFNRLMDKAQTDRLIAAREMAGTDWVWFVRDEPPTATP